MNCNFDAKKCTIECAKYPMCSYYSIQNQISEIQSQLNFLYTSISSIVDKIKVVDVQMNLLTESLSKVNNTEDCFEKEYK